MFWHTGECSLSLESCSRKALSVSWLVTVGAAVKPLHTVLIFSAARKNSAYSSRCGNMLDPGDSHTSLSPVDCRIWSALKFPSAMSVWRYTHLRNNLSNQDSEANHITHLFSSSFQLSGRFTPGCGQHGQNSASSAVRNFADGVAIALSHLVPTTPFQFLQPSPASRQAPEFRISLNDYLRCQGLSLSSLVADSIGMPMSYTPDWPSGSPPERQR